MSSVLLHCNQLFILPLVLSTHVYMTFCDLLYDFIEIFTWLLLNHICELIFPIRNWTELWSGSDLVREPS